MTAERPGAGAESPGGERRTDPVRLLIMQSQDYFGADSRIQAELAGALDKELVEVHVACNAGRRDQPSASLAKFRAIDGIALRPTRFGPTRTGATRVGLLRDAVVQGPVAAASLFGLLRYCRRHRIEIVHGTEKPRDAWYGYLLSRLIGARCIVHVHIKAELWIRRSVRRAMGRSELLAISDFVAGSLRDLGYASEHIHTVLNGLDMSDWDPDKHDGGRVPGRARLGR